MFLTPFQPCSQLMLDRFKQKLQVCLLLCTYRSFNLKMLPQEAMNSQYPTLSYFTYSICFSRCGETDIYAALPSVYVILKCIMYIKEQNLTFTSYILLMTTLSNIRVMYAETHRGSLFLSKNLCMHVLHLSRSTSKG